nr:uncharacterized protein LOC111422042 isoform X2 [Onthophagus taurus]
MEMRDLGLYDSPRSPSPTSRGVIINRMEEVDSECEDDDNESSSSSSSSSNIDEMGMRDRKSLFFILLYSIILFSQYFFIVGLYDNPRSPSPTSRGVIINRMEEVD